MQRIVPAHPFCGLRLLLLLLLVLLLPSCAVLALVSIRSCSSPRSSRLAFATTVSSWSRTRLHPAPLLPAAAGTSSRTLPATGTRRYGAIGTSSYSPDLLFAPRRGTRPHHLGAPQPNNRDCGTTTATTPLWSSLSDDDNNKDDDDDKENAPSQPRIKAKFDKLFSGMPSMQDILRGAAQNDDEDEEEEDDDNNNNLLASPPADNDANPKKSSRASQRQRDYDTDDYSWFEEEKKQIQLNYDQMYESMLQQLDEERQRLQESGDPAEQEAQAIPENAPALIQSVLKQEMEREINRTRKQRIDERLGAYEVESRKKADARDVGADADVSESVQRLMDQSEAEYQQQEANRLEVADFLKYEQEAVWKNKKAAAALDNVDNGSDTTTSSNDNFRRPVENEDLDQWALDRLKEMAGRDRADSDGDEMILDILQENVLDLEARMRKEASSTRSDGGSRVQPETMKEWQMYRAIATRLAATAGSSTTAEKGDEEPPAREQEILLRLEAWKDYIQKEEGIRKRSGLSRGPKLPFAWQESLLLEREMPKSGASDKQSRIDTRKQLNRMSIEAMESLLTTTGMDAARRERLQKEIDFLKTTLEGKDYLDVDESFLEDTAASTSPIDVSNLFQTSSSLGDEKDAPTSFVDSYDTGSSSKSSSSPSASGEAQFSGSRSNGNNEPTLPPKTPFFEDNYNDDDIPAKSVPRPNTAFFAAEGGEGDETDNLGETLTGEDSKLGTMEDQKLEAMYRRAGARTTEERAAIRQQWEGFKEFEKKTREQSGLSSGQQGGEGGTEDVVASGDLKYNISDVVREDGDIDADAILASIGPRPSRKKKTEGTTPSDSTSSITDTTDKDNEDIDYSRDSSVGKEEVMDSLYRAVSAVGGGRYKDDPDANAEQQASYEEYMKKEKELRDSLDKPDLGDNVAVPTTDDGSEMDDVEYAEEVLSSLGSRPKPKRARKIDPGDYSDKGGVLSSSDYDDSFGETEETDDESDDVSNESDDNVMPEWLRKENEEKAIKKQSGINMKRRGSFLGSEIDEVFDDTDYEHNMRQLAEFERRRAGKERQMGIDISDVLGRSAFDSDDYADYKYEDTRGRQGGSWSGGSFAARKANLLEYVELDVLELNNLMDHKDSVYSTGVSQYLPRINKPFSEFGAVFRMEGVLLDVNGLQLEAWTKVAEQYGFTPPSLDDVRRAGVTRPEVAVKEVFLWSDDFLECRDVASFHKQAFKDVFKAWTDKNGITVPEIPVMDWTKGNLAIGVESTDASPQPAFPRPTSENEKIELVSQAWTATAEAFGKEAPSREAIVVAASLSPDIAVRKAFGWSADPLEVDRIVQMYRRNLRSDSAQDSVPASFPANSAPAATAGTGDSPRRPLTQTDVMEIHFRAWTSVAESFGFDPPDSEEVLAAFVINEPEAAVQGFGWSEDPQVLRDVAGAFTDKVAELKRGGGIAEAAPEIVPEREKEPSVAPTDSGPSPDEIFQVSFDAWKATAKGAGLPEPDTEQVQFALSVGPEEAIRTGFEWSSNWSEIAKLVEKYKGELARGRSAWKTDSSTAAARWQPPVTATTTEAEPSGPSADEVYLAALNAWTDTAKQFGFPEPDDEQVQFAMSVGPEEAVVSGFDWTTDRTKVSEIVDQYKTELGKRRSNWIQRGAAASEGAKSSSGSSKSKEVPMFQVNPGAAKWVKSLLDVEMKCGVVSYLENDQVNVLLKQAGLDDLIPPDKRVSSSNGYATDKDQVLGAALRLERRPDHCVVFDSTPYASIAAHDAGMQSVNLIGPYPRYELLSADTTSNSFEDLTAMNIRRLFSERVYDQPMVDSQQNQPEKRAVTKTKYFYDDD